MPRWVRIGDHGVVAAVGDPLIPPGQRLARLRSRLGLSDLDGLLLTHAANVAYAGDVVLPGGDVGRAPLLRTIAVVSRADDVPHLFTPWLPGSVSNAEHPHPPCPLNLDEGCAEVVALLRELGCRRVGVDDCPWALARAARSAGIELLDASGLVTSVRALKTPEEVACLEVLQRRNEELLPSVVPAVRPGTRSGALTARLVRLAVEQGLGVAIDPVWQVVPRRRSVGVWTVDGDPAFPVSVGGDAPVKGDLLWVDTGLTWPSQPG